MKSWTDYTPTELLDVLQSLTFEQTAYAINATKSKGPCAGKPDPVQVRQLVRAGKLRVVDERVPRSQLRISAAEVRRYLAAGTKGPRSIGISA